MVQVMELSTLDAPRRPSLGTHEDAVLGLLEPGAIVAVFQPIVRLTDSTVVGYEGLSRAVDPAAGPPDTWFATAAALGITAHLEAACLRSIAIAGPPPDDRLLFVNVGPAEIDSPLVLAAAVGLPDRLVIEVGERELVHDVGALRSGLRQWTSRGSRVALDDVGAGYAGLRQIVQLRPEFLKLDRALIQGIATDRTRQAMVGSLATFAREVGASIVAEGVEEEGDLRWLRECGVALGQGYLFARPGPPWSDAARPQVIPSLPRPVEDDALDRHLATCGSAREACEAVADHLFAIGGIMPSVYLEAGGRLRCQAQRGLWQVLDGMEPSAGITGRTFRTGVVQLVSDVRNAPDYLEAIPGVVAELCIPIRAGSRVVGALNVESLVPFPDEVLREVHRVTQQLGHRLAGLPQEVGAVPLRQLALTMSNLLAATGPASTAASVVDAACELTGLDSGAVVRDDGGRPRVLAASGPLAQALAATSADDFRQLDLLLAPLTSCYSSGEATGLAFVGGEALRAAGACSVLAVPLVVPGRRIGVVLLASTQPVALGPQVVEPAELLATLAGSCLELTQHVEELQARARLDTLTGLENHASFHEALRECNDADHLGVAMFDVDGFKRVNDTRGHLAGDAVLRGAAAAMAAELPEGARLFRVGGDELAALLPGDAGPALASARAMLAASRTVLASTGAGMSAGFAVRAGAEDLLGCVARADAALYAAKRDGGGLHEA